MEDRRAGSGCSWWSSDSSPKAGRSTLEAVKGFFQALLSKCIATPMKHTSRDNGSRRFVVATPQRSVCDDNARALEQSRLLRFLALGTRRGTAGVPSERTRLNFWIGLSTYAAARVFGTFQAESFRFRLLPWFDRWVLKQLQPGDHIISSYGYANGCFKFVRQHGGKTFIDAGNSHIENFFEIVSEEHRRWKCPIPPMPRFWHERSRAMLAETDYV